MSNRRRELTQPRAHLFDRPFTAAIRGQLPRVPQRTRDVGAPRRVPLLLRDRRPLFSLRRTGIKVEFW